MKQNNIYLPYHIKNLTTADFKEFEKVVSLFKLPPFSEVLTKQDMIEEFDHCLSEGFIAGAFTQQGELMGIAEFVKGFQEEHAEFVNLPEEDKENTWYIHGLATLQQYRSSHTTGPKLHVCTNLVIHGIDQVAKDPMTKWIYMRITKDNSMSEHLAERQGFFHVLKNGKYSIQNIDPTLEDPYRAFLCKAMKENANLDWMYQLTEPVKVMKKEA